MNFQPKSEPGSPPIFESNGHRNMSETMSISEIVSAMHAGVDRFQEVLLAKHKAEIGPLQEKFELERLMRLQAEEELERAQQDYEALLKKVKESEFCDGHSTEVLRNMKPELKRKRVDDYGSNNIVAELRIRVAELEIENLKLEDAKKKNMETIEMLRAEITKLECKKNNVFADAEPLGNIEKNISVGRNSEGEPQIPLQRNLDTRHSLGASEPLENAKKNNFVGLNNERKPQTPLQTNIDTRHSLTASEPLENAEKNNSVGGNNERKLQTPLQRNIDTRHSLGAPGKKRVRRKKPDTTVDPSQHIITAIQAVDHMSKPLRCCYGWVQDDPPYEIQPILQQTGLHHLAEIKNIAVDKNLISALVERWRPETHTFHFPYGECTVTLEDVALLFGLPINGRPVTGLIPSSVEQAKAMCEELLGVTPDSEQFKRNVIHIDWLKAHFGSNLRRDRDNVDYATILQWHARGYILILLGVILFPDKSKEVVHTKYIGLLQDLGEIHTYSWGSACLTFLYRALCRATRKDCKQIDGALILLQTWAWYRLPFLAPVPHYRWTFPLATRWIKSSRANDVDCPMTRIGYRRALDRMAPENFIWQPYLNDTIEQLIPDSVKQDIPLCLATVPLICFEAVEWHAPNRVMRQFGLEQLIPTEPQSLDNSHNIDLRRNPSTGNWISEHDSWIKRWNSRHLNIIGGNRVETYTPSKAYWAWYRTSSMSMVVSPEPLLNDPRLCPLPIHRTRVVVQQVTPPNIQPSNQNWPSWDMATER